MDRRRFVILVADSAGCGALPDAGDYGDLGSDTIGNTSRAVGGLALPTLGRMGLGHVTEILGVPPDPAPLAFHGRMAERSKGKDTITGHWEMMGIVLREALALYPGGFPPEILEPFLRATGAPGVLGTEAASGTVIIQELGEEHQRTGKPIVYTSADSVFQIAAHEETVPLETLYAWCLAARRILDPFRVARVIARPFVGTPGSYRRTYNRRDFALAAPGPTVLEKLVGAGVPVVGRHRQHVTGTQAREEAGHRAVELLERAAVPGGVVAVAVEHVEVDQVHEDEPAVDRLEEALGPGEPVGVAVGVDLVGDALAVEDVGDLPHPYHRDPVVHQALQHRGRRRRDGEVLAVVGPRVGPGDPHERPRDDARDPPRVEELPRTPSDPPPAPGACTSSGTYSRE